MKTYGLYESASVKIQVLKTAIEVSFVCSQLFFSTVMINDSFRLRGCYFGWMTWYRQCVERKRVVKLNPLNRQIWRDDSILRV